MADRTKASTSDGKHFTGRLWQREGSTFVAKTHGVGRCHEGLALSQGNSDALRHSELFWRCPAPGARQLFSNPKASVRQNTNRNQRAIASFLDRETGKIDALIAKKKRLIELLQEKGAQLNGFQAVFT